MALPRILLALVAGLPLTVLACTSSPGGADGSGGSASTSGGGGGSLASGGALGTGGNAAGGATSGGASSDGNSSGGATGGAGDGLGGEAATGGAVNSGGTAGDGGTGGSVAEPYGPCDEDLGEENNPDCAAGEVCFANTCMESCPTNLNDAATYACPEVTSATPPSQCAFVFGRCELVCEGQGSLPDYECPAGMDCQYARCVWP